MEHMYGSGGCHRERRVGDWGGVKRKGRLAAREVAGGQRAEDMYKKSDVQVGNQDPLAVFIAGG